MLENAKISAAYLSIKSQFYFESFNQSPISLNVLSFAKCPVKHF